MKRISLSMKQMIIGLVLGALTIFSFYSCGAFDPLGESGVGLKLYFSNSSYDIYVYDVIRNEAKCIYDNPGTMGGYGRMVVDSKNKKLYFADNFISPAKIYRCNLDGTGAELFFTLSDTASTVYALAVNPNSNSIYVATAANTIEEIDIQTGQPRSVVTTSDACTSLAWDDIHSKLYRISFTTPDIYEIGQPSAIYTGTGSLGSLTIEPAKNIMCWFENDGAGNGPVYCASRADMASKTILWNISDTDALKCAIDPRNKDVYWAAYDRKLYVKSSNEQAPRVLYQHNYDIVCVVIDIYP